MEGFWSGLGPVQKDDQTEKDRFVEIASSMCFTPRSVCMSSQTYSERFTFKRKAVSTEAVAGLQEAAGELGAGVSAALASATGGNTIAASRAWLLCPTSSATARAAGWSMTASTFDCDGKGAS